MKIGKEEAKIMAQIAQEEDKLKRQIARRNPATDTYFRNELGTTPEELRELTVTGCLDQAPEQLLYHQPSSCTRRSK